MLEAHRPLLADRVRMTAYRAAIQQLVARDSVVLDLGTGTGVLALFAAQGGARRVFAVEEQHTADVAAFLARHLRLAGVEVIHEKSTAIELPERATLLVTETLGAFGLEEQILSSVLDARRRLLTTDATILPHSVALSAVPVELPGVFERHVGWWEESRYELDLSPLAVFASNAIYVADIEESSWLGVPQTIIDVNLQTFEDIAVTGHASFEATRDGVLHGFGGWFTALLAPGVELSNSAPRGTHWQQVFLPLERPHSVQRGETIDLTIDTDDGKAWRWRGAVQGVRFDQTTWLSKPPCRAANPE